MYRGRDKNVKGSAKPAIPALTMALGWWKTVWAPAIASGTEANQASAGTVVMARSHVGMAEPPGGVIVVPGHVCTAMVEVSCMGWLVVYSVYGHCGDELGAKKWSLCDAIACHAAAYGLQWAAAGDWNFEPHTLGASGWLATMSADMITAGDAATTHSGHKQGRQHRLFRDLQRCGGAGAANHSSCRRDHQDS